MCALVQTDGMNRYVCTTGEDGKVGVWKYADMKLVGEIDLGAPAILGTGSLHKTAELLPSPRKMERSACLIRNQETRANVSLEQGEKQRL